MRSREVQRVLLVILGLNVLVAVAKAIYGFWSGSLAVASDAVHSFLDGASNVVGLVALRLATEPPDPEHPYGHRKMEMVAATFIGMLIAGGALRFGWSAIQALFDASAAPRATVGGFVVMGVTLVVNVFVTTWEARRGRALGSHFLLADAAHTGSDVLVTLTVIVSLVASRYGIAWADPVAALLVLGVIAWVAWRILSENLGVLMDRAVMNPQEIVAVVRSVPGVSSCHRIRSRGPEDAIHLDLHVLMDGELPLRRAHDISHDVEEALRKKFPGLVDITIHVEPTGDPVEGL